MILFSAEHLSGAIFWHRKTFSRAKSIPSSCARLQKSSFYHLGRNLLSTYMQKMLSSWKMFNTKQQKITLPRKPFYFQVQKPSTQTYPQGLEIKETSFSQFPYSFSLKIPNHPNSRNKKIPWKCRESMPSIQNPLIKTTPKSNPVAKNKCHQNPIFFYGRRQCKKRKF